MDPTKRLNKILAFIRMPAQAQKTRWVRGRVLGLTASRDMSEQDAGNVPQKPRKESRRWTSESVTIAPVRPTLISYPFKWRGIGDNVRQMNLQDTRMVRDGRRSIGSSPSGSWKRRYDNSGRSQTRSTSSYASIATDGTKRVTDVLVLRDAALWRTLVAHSTVASIRIVSRIEQWSTRGRRVADDQARGSDPDSRREPSESSLWKSMERGRC